MRRPVSSFGPARLAPVLFAALAVTAACDRHGAEVQAASSPAASSSAAPVQWDLASNDPAKNPYAANKEADTPGYNP